VTVHADERTTSGTVRVPASTSAPLFAALGLTLVAAALVTHPLVGAAGLLLLGAGTVGWFREVFPEDRHETVGLAPPPVPVAPGVRAVRRGPDVPHRARLPVEIYPVTAGVRGGIAGGIAMAALAVLHGLLAHGSPWYTVNLLAAAASPALASADADTLATFSASGLVLAVLIHAVVSVLVGLLYGALLPTFPWRPLFSGGVLAPLVWTGLLAASLHVLNPALNRRIEWRWFVASQIAFGLVAGAVVTRAGKVPTPR
jgi:hypothetical protein